MRTLKRFKVDNVRVVKARNDPFRRHRHGDVGFEWQPDRREAVKIKQGVIENVSMMELEQGCLEVERCPCRVLMACDDGYKYSEQRRKIPNSSRTNTSLLKQEIYYTTEIFHSTMHLSYTTLVCIAAHLVVNAVALPVVQGTTPPSGLNRGTASSVKTVKV